MSVINSTLPVPSDDERSHSRQLRELICRYIDEAEGFLEFDRFMEAALYEPGLGYYAAGARKFGEGGDFITAPETSALFAQCLANQCVEILGTFQRSVCILELGAGTGVMAADILAELERRECLPDHYYILELSADLREHQQRTLQAKVPHLAASVKWLDSLPTEGFYGVVLANEVLDAMPIKLFSKQGEGVDEIGVGHEGGELNWRVRQADAQMSERVLHLEKDAGQPWVDGYRSEFNPHLGAWMKSLEGSLSEAAVFLIDYGYPRREYYHDQRVKGTLTCYYRHHSVEAPLNNVGLQDITAHVDFTAVVEAGTDAGLEFEGYTSQAFFLMANGLDALFEAQAGASEKERITLSREVKLLTLPSEMGERFQVMGFSKGLKSPISGFSLQDLSYKL